MKNQPLMVLENDAEKWKELVNITKQRIYKDENYILKYMLQMQKNIKTTYASVISRNSKIEHVPSIFVEPKSSRGSVSTYRTVTKVIHTDIPVPIIDVFQKPHEKIVVNCVLIKIFIKLVVDKMNENKDENFEFSIQQ